MGTELATLWVIALLALGPYPIADGKTNTEIAASRTDTEIEYQLRAIVQAELKWSKREIAELEKIIAGLDAGDDSWRPDVRKRSRYIEALRHRRLQLIDELNLKRSKHKPKHIESPTQI